MIHGAFGSIWNGIKSLVGTHRPEPYGGLGAYEVAVLARLSDTAWSTADDLVEWADGSGRETETAREITILLDWPVRCGYVEKREEDMALPAKEMRPWNVKRITYRRTEKGRRLVEQIDAAAAEAVR